MIRFEKVSKSFGINGQAVQVINKIDLRVQERDTFGLVGETGSGKSTILRMMNGFIEPDEGEIYLMGQKLDGRSKYNLVRDTSMIFQAFNLLGNLNVLDNVLLPLRLRKEKRRKIIARGRELLSFVGMENHENSYIRTLSGGEKQRVAIARSLITNPRLIFCDEPSSALDEKMSYEILKLLRDIRDQFGTSIVIVSHDIDVIKALCNRVAIIENGRILDTISLSPKELEAISYKEALLND